MELYIKEKCNIFKEKRGEKIEKIIYVSIGSFPIRRYRCV